MKLKETRAPTRGRRTPRSKSSCRLSTLAAFISRDKGALAIISCVCVSWGSLPFFLSSLSRTCNARARAHISRINVARDVANRIAAGKEREREREREREKQGPLKGRTRGHEILACAGRGGGDWGEGKAGLKALNFQYCVVDVARLPARRVRMP